MATENTVELRGHHLSLFADYYFRNKERPKDNFSLECKYKFVEEDYIARKYSPEMRKRMNNLWKKLVDNPQTSVKIVRGLDILCRGCPNYNPAECNIETAEEDNFTVDEYEICSGKPYCSKALMDRFEAYRKASGFKNPRERVLALIPEFDNSKDDEISDEEIDRIMNGGGK